MKKEYYTIGFEEEVFKIPKRFLNKYKKDARLIAKKEFSDDIWKIWGRRYGNPKTSNETVFDMHDVIREAERKHLNTNNTDKSKEA